MPGVIDTNKKVGIKSPNKLRLITVRHRFQLNRGDTPPLSAGQVMVLQQGPSHQRPQLSPAVCNAAPSSGNTALIFIFASAKYKINCNKINKFN